jgi:hypothetical protein
MTPFPTRINLTVDGKPAIARVLCGELLVLWGTHIARRKAVAKENLMLLSATLTTAGLTAAGFTVT